VPEAARSESLLPEQVADMNERTLHPLDYVDILRRRKGWFVTSVAICVAGGVALALLLPKTYRTSATIAVQAPAVALDLVPRTALDRTERLRAISQQLRSPALLERVAREEGLAAQRPIEPVVQDLLSRITVDVPPPLPRTEGTQEINAFDIVYRDRTAERTERIANRLATLFVEEQSRSRENQAEGTAEFLGQRLRTSEDRIAALEQRLRRVKEQHMGRLPEQTIANLQTLSGVRQQLEMTSNNLRSEQDRLSLLDRQLQSTKTGVGVPGAPQPQGTASPQQRILAAERELGQARAKYTDKHPEVQYLEQELRTARADAAAIGQQPDATRQELLAADPGYQQVLAERNLTQLRIRALQRSEAQLQADIGRYQQRIEAAPMVEQELASTEREYAFERENYRQLSERHAAALVQQQIARTRGGERFSVLNAAVRPDSPESPNRPRILLMAFALGLALGGALAFGRDYLDPSIRTARAVQDEFDLPVLAEIPHIRGAA
jgi:protein tyrosine kinase modulator